MISTAVAVLLAVSPHVKVFGANHQPASKAAIHPGEQVHSSTKS